ncbi:hypothetical protein BDN70DRAFT_793852 [Pholiota conissans]|uniref:Uncharacterized protein n=1 Tax=Pholiota conissans TaxID=109636 RepID=A0A9P6D817_9AGAR|nr:hypothetical protein BDN70DRAFT_793852 [Pholiota conissans]
MSTKNARTLSHPSNREKPKDAKEKKVVFKGVLDNPFRIQWPSVPMNLQNSILSCIIKLLEDAADYHYKRCAESRKRKRSTNSADTVSKKAKCSTTTATKQDDIDEAIATETFIDKCQKPEQDNKDEPLFLRHLLFGINAVTKRLETQVQAVHSPNVSKFPETSTKTLKSLMYVFVCRADVDPALLIAHLPHLVAAYNSTRPSQYIKLIPLPQGAEFLLAQTLGIRRVTVLAVDVDYPDDSKLKAILESIPILTASWLSQPKAIAPLISTHIKHLRTTVPKDMKEAKELRLKGKAAARQKRFTKSKLSSPT